MTPRKIAAFIIIVLTILFPFRLAYVNQPESFHLSLIYFLLTLVGCAIFGALLSGDSKKKVEMTVETAKDQNRKEAA